MLGPIIIALLLAVEPQAPAQPSAEENVGAIFEAAVPGLFKEWLAPRPVAQATLALGVQGVPRLPACNKPGKRYGLFFVFTECTDRAEPVVDGFDVLKTDSVISPFLGVITVKVAMTCEVKRLSPTQEAWESVGTVGLSSACIGKRYDDCLQAGMAPPKKLSAFNWEGSCSGGPSSKFSHEGVIRLTYAWKHGRWEFQKEEGANPTPPPEKT